MICLTIKIRFGDHEIAKHGSRNMRYLFLANMRASKQFKYYSKYTIERNIKNDDFIVKITHTHTHIEKLYNYYV